MKPRIRKSLFALGLLIGTGLYGGSSMQAQVQPHAGMLRYPDVSQSHIVFSYANDLWLVARSGGTAIPLASPPGQELFPRFSPSGKTIAFQGNYDGNRDLYTISIAGGVANRLTHHPSGETICDWIGEEELLFFGNSQSPFPRLLKLFRVSASGGLPQQLPVPYGAMGALNSTGEWLAYTPNTRDNRTWKRYQGGMASDIWLFNLKLKASTKITDWVGTDTQPMWHGKKLYYLSDQGSQNRLNIWMYDLQSGQKTQITKFQDYDVKWPAMGPGENGQGEIVFQLGAELRLLDLATLQSNTVSISVPGDRTFLRPQTEDASRYIQAWDISPSGKRATVQARGDIWTLPAEKGSPRNLTRTNGVAERDPAWSPDGRWIAYFSDATGEYEIYVTQSDGKGETKQLTKSAGAFKLGMVWSPDSEHLLFVDKGAALHLHTLETGETKLVDKNPWGIFGGNLSMPSWSHDGRWITYSRGLDDVPSSAVWIYEVETGTKRQVTSGMFNDTSPTFDRKGDWLFFSSNRSFSPRYSDIDTTFIYDQSEVLLAVPLRADMSSPYSPESDEEEFDDDEGEEESEEEEGKEDESEEGESEEEPAPVEDDGVSGSWEGKITGQELPPGGLEMSAEIYVAADGSVSGSFSTDMGSGEIVSGAYDKANGSLQMTIRTDEGIEVVVEGTLKNESFTGTGSIPAFGQSFDIELQRTAAAPSDSSGDEGDSKKKDKKREVVEIDFDGFERRAILLPVNNGNFGALSVNDKNQLLFARFGEGGANVRLFDLEDDKKEEKQVASGGNFTLTPDGKHILVVRGNSSASIQKASSGASGKTVPTKNMMVSVNPLEEWRQLFTDAWRIQRDFFYAANMHGVDWQKIHDQYMAMIEHCASREDVTFVMGEMIAELNVGHAYLTSGGDGENASPRVSVGMLGVDFEMHSGQYRISKIHEGAPWDSDARGPLSQPGVDAKVGDYLLAVNGVPMDTSKDPWAAFQGMAGQVINITLSETTELDENARDLTLTPLGSEYNLRYRSWIERNRNWVAEQTDNQVGYIHVPDTGVNGQNNLYRQIQGQLGKGALIIDERWNGGGQIPTRFIEMLNRPVTNYWATRDGKDWHWPPDSHQGPKCMLINGLSGSGGDAFPAYFKQAGLGKLIGTRTWGGLVGISGNPALIDGGSVSVPTFAYYENDGTWGIEGHGVEPDIEVVDDPALMQGGADPQLQAAVDLMKAELQSKPYAKPGRPAYPDRSGAGITAEDK